jgi:hypothetical protein
VKRFFFEKKNQKTFVHLHGAEWLSTVQRVKSLFASFSSEKEESCLLPPAGASAPGDRGVGFRRAQA